MYCKTVCITNKLGVHARASAKLTNMASLFKSNIALVFGPDISLENPSDEELFALVEVFWSGGKVGFDNVGRKVCNAKSIMGVMMASVPKGGVLCVCASGEDEIHAIDAIESLISGKFEEGE